MPSKKINSDSFKKNLWKIHFLCNFRSKSRFFSNDNSDKSCAIQNYATFFDPIRPKTPRPDCLANYLLEGKFTSNYKWATFLIRIWLRNFFGNEWNFLRPSNYVEYILVNYYSINYLVSIINWPWDVADFSLLRNAIIFGSQSLRFFDSLYEFFFPN